MWRKVTRKILSALGFQTQEVSITFVTDKIIKELNLHYRGMDSATDVLAFAMQEGEFKEISPDLLGDVVISVETAQRQAAESEHSLEKEVGILLIHGLLHLSGYDHMTDKDAKRMQAKEQELWQYIQPDIS
ncbi:MAG: rRNA maturation RNase YbeY [bacterium]